MTEEELSKFEHEAEDALKHIAGDVPVSEGKLLSPKVVEILIRNAQKTGEDVTYSSTENNYVASFSYVEIPQDDGNIGLYEDLPPDLDPKDAQTVTFLVKGFHSNQETEVEISEGKIMLNRDREHRHLIDFQRAVMKKGLI